VQARFFTDRLIIKKWVSSVRLECRVISECLGVRKAGLPPLVLARIQVPKQRGQARLPDPEVSQLEF
jgi:hypothetical protein